MREVGALARRAGLSGRRLPTLTIDPTRIRQVILNLLSNALKFTREGYVHIDVDAVAGNEQETSIHFRVSDTGIGLEFLILTGLVIGLGILNAISNASVSVVEAKSVDFGGSRIIKRAISAW